MSRTKNDSTADEELLPDPSFNEDVGSSTVTDDKALRMMQKMGYKPGKGLGISEQGIQEPLDISPRFGTLGLGYHSFDDVEIELEEVSVQKRIDWLENTETLDFSLETLQSYLIIGHPLNDMANRLDFCDEDIFDDIAEAKEVFNKYEIPEFNKARGRANPFEKIHSVFFLNRAALKLADIDASTNFMFTGIDQDIHHCDSKGPFYFADVCAGPGGFSEYILWRKSWYFKGLGFTLRGPHDFKLHNSCCISPYTFQAFYGSNADGDVCCPENIADFKEKVFLQTEGKGVHFMTSDGGFCVDGNEDNQEMLSKNIYLCQCLVALEILRDHGHFVTKMFDVFTRFSVGLIYLMYKCFRKVTILKPNTSRPANAERYLICADFRNDPDVDVIRKYLRFVAEKLWEERFEDQSDALEIFPVEEIKNDVKFFQFIEESNNTLGKSQVAALRKIDNFCENTSYRDPRQDELKIECLRYWQIPNLDKHTWEANNNQIDKFLIHYVENADWMTVDPITIDHESLSEKISDILADSVCYGLYSSKLGNSCGFFAGFSKKTCKWKNGTWVKVKYLTLSKGSLIYGEIVKEICRSSKENSESELSFKYSFHIIDAVCLGNISLDNDSFQERMNRISIFAESHNQEFDKKSIRIRKKPAFYLSSFKFSSCLRKSEDQGDFEVILPTIGFSSTEEFHKINSLLFLKRNTDQVLQSTFVLRMQYYLERDEDVESFNILMKELKSSSQR